MAQGTREVSRHFLLLRSVSGPCFVVLLRQSRLSMVPIDVENPAEEVKKVASSGCRVVASASFGARDGRKSCQEGALDVGPVHGVRGIEPSVRRKLSSTKIQRWRKFAMFDFSTMSWSLGCEESEWERPQIQDLETFEEVASWCAEPGSTGPASERDIHVPSD